MSAHIDLDALLSDIADATVERAIQMYAEGATDDQVMAYLRAQVEEAAFARRVLRQAVTA